MCAFVEKSETHQRSSSKMGALELVAPGFNSTEVQSFAFCLTQRDTHATAYATKLKSSCMRGEELEENCMNVGSTACVLKTVNRARTRPVGEEGVVVTFNHNWSRFLAHYHSHHISADVSGISEHFSQNSSGFRQPEGKRFDMHIRGGDITVRTSWTKPQLEPALFHKK